MTVIAATVSPADRALLPSAARYRPISRRQWYGRRLPLAFVIGLGMFGVFFALLGVLGGSVVWWAIIALYAGVFLRLFRRRRRIAGLLREHDEGLALLAGGELDRAGAAFEALCEHGRSMPPLHSLFVYYRGLVELQLGHLDSARGMFLAVLHAGWLSSWASTLTTHHPRALTALATCEALRGDVLAAARWRDLAREKTSAARSGALALVDALILARTDDHEAAVSTIDGSWRSAENLLQASQLRALRLIKAYCLEQLGRRGYRDASRDAEMRAAIDASRPLRHGELDYLGARWPQLREFLERHRLMQRDGGAQLT